jgi:hypothetical protein
VNAITKNYRRAVVPGKLTTEAESKLQDAVGVLIDVNLVAEEGTALAAEAHNLAMGLLAFIDEYKGRGNHGGSV